jgi:hypothetical protein
MRTRAQQRRDVALRRLASTNRWLTVATVVATGVLVEMIARNPLGHTAKGETVNVASRQPSTTNGGSHARASGPHTSERLRNSSAPKSASSADPASSSAAAAGSGSASSDPAASSPSAPAQASSPAPAPAPVVVVQLTAPSTPVVVSGGS